MRVMRNITRQALSKVLICVPYVYALCVCVPYVHALYDGALVHT